MTRNNFSISTFPTLFSKGFFFRAVETRNRFGNGHITYNSSLHKPISRGLVGTLPPVLRRTSLKSNSGLMTNI